MPVCHLQIEIRGTVVLFRLPGVNRGPQSTQKLVTPPAREGISRLMAPHGDLSVCAGPIELHVRLTYRGLRAIAHEG